MRTDSTTLSDGAVQSARAQVRELFSAEHLPDVPRTYASKVKNAQEAHEAIRPSGQTFQTPAQTGLTGEQFRLYEAIPDAHGRLADEGRRRAVGLGAGRRCRLGRPRRRVQRLGAGHHVPRLPQGLRRGHRRRQPSYHDQVPLPELTRLGDPVTAASLSASGHETKPPARYTEATLIKEASRSARSAARRRTPRSSPRSSTAATSTKGTALVPAWIAFSTIRAAGGALPQADLLRVHRADGGRPRRDRGGRQGPGERAGPLHVRLQRVQGLHDLITNLGEIDARAATFPIGDPDLGINLRVGRYGPYLEGPDDEGNPTGKRANVPDDLPPDELHHGEGEGACSPTPPVRQIQPRRAPGERARGGGQERPLRPLRHRTAARGRQEERPAAHRFLFKSMSLDSITLEDALKLPSPPRVAGADLETGEEITAQNGRYGPYLKKGTDSRSLTAEDQLPTIGSTSVADLRPAQAARPRSRRPAAEGSARTRSGQPAGGESGGSASTSPTVVQRHPAQGRHRRGDHLRAAAGLWPTAVSVARPRRPPRRPGRRRPPRSRRRRRPRRPPRSPEPLLRVDATP